MYKTALSTSNSTSETFFQGCANAGINLVEISASKKEDFDALNHKEIASWSKKYSVDIWSYHLPFAPFSEIDISNKNLSKQTVEYLTEVIEKVTDIGVNKFVLHPSGEPIADEERAERKLTAQESLVKLAEVASRCGAVIAVENLPRTCLGKNSTEILELISVDDRLKACFDTNHLLSQSSSDFIKAVGKKIITTHVSDYDFLNERHWLPGEGDIAWQTLIKDLQSVGYDGPWLYEVTLGCPKTIRRERNLTFADFTKNAREIFENKPLTVFGKRVEGLGK